MRLLNYSVLDAWKRRGLFVVFLMLFVSLSTIASAQTTTAPVTTKPATKKEPPKAPVVAACPKPTPANAATIGSQSAAIAALAKWKADSTGKDGKLSCSDPKTTFAECSTVASDLVALAKAATAASESLKKCAYGGLAADVDVPWFKNRAAVWDHVAVEQTANPVSFLNGTYKMPTPLMVALLDAYANTYTYPFITISPVDASVDNGKKATFKVSASNADSYAWYEIAPGKTSGTPIKGATSNVYETPATKAVDNGSTFYVEVTNAAGSVNSATVTLTVNGPDPASMATAQKNLLAEYNSILLEEAICIKERDSSCLKGLKKRYITFQSDASAAVKTFPEILADKDSVTPVSCTTTTIKQDWPQAYLRLENIQREKSKSLSTGRFAFCLADLTTNVIHSRVLAGIDVSAASSADPAARFLLDAALNVPISTGNPSSSGIKATSWLWGYARLSSIAQPGTVSGVAAPSTYLSGLIGAAPNNIVQSFEATGGYEHRITTFDSTLGRRPIMISFIADGGIITPLSTSQATPPIYTMTPALESFYSQQYINDPSTVNTENITAINTACGITTSVPTPFPTCYFAQYPVARSRFFRNYGAGFRIKRYYYNDADQVYIFPATFDATIGQNDYVTGGELHRLVAHFGGSTPLPPLGNLTGLYVYAYLDMELSRSNIPTQQFLLNGAPSTITTSSSNFAAVFVAQPDRDRYRFGIAYDLTTLIGKLTKKQ